MSLIWSKVVMGTITHNISRAKCMNVSIARTVICLDWDKIAELILNEPICLVLIQHLRCCCVSGHTSPASSRDLRVNLCWCYRASQDDIVWSLHNLLKIHKLWDHLTTLSLSISSSYSGYDVVWYIEYTPYTSPCLHPFVWNPVIEFNLSSKNRMKNSKNLEYIPPWQWDGPSNMLHMQEGEGAKIRIG